MIVRALAAMAVTAVRLNLNGVRFDDVLDFLVTGWFGVVASVNSVQFALSVVTVTAFVLAQVGVIVVVLYTPVQVVMSGVLHQLNHANINSESNTRIQL